VENREGEKGTKTGWFTRPKLITAGVVLVALVILGFAIGGKKLHLSATSKGKLTTVTKPTPTPTPVKLASAPNGVVLDRPGAMGTKQFTAAGDWGFDWSYDCSKLKVSSNFIVSVYDSQGHVSADTPPVIQVGLKGNGTKQYHKPGTYFLGVNSRCEWHITAKASPPQAPPQP
jgi:hypothetical protein